MQDRPTERVRVLLDGLTASAIVDRVHPYYSGYQFEGEWLDTLKESIEGELDDLDRTIRGRAGTVGAVDRLREYVANAPASSMGEMARAIVRNYCDAIEVEAGDPTGARRFAERLEAAASERADVTLFGTDYTALPMDADGEPVHIGDVMEWSTGETSEVIGVGDGGTFFYFRKNDDGTGGINEMIAKLMIHHHAPTVEDVLREFAQEMNENLGMYTGEAIDADEWREADESTIAEYAAKLRLAGDE